MDRRHTSHFYSVFWRKAVTGIVTDTQKSTELAPHARHVHGTAGRCAADYDSEAHRIDPMVTWRAWGIPVRCGAGMVVLQTLLALYRFGDSTALLQL